MKAPPFRYHRPGTLADAIGLLGRLDNARVLAGGQSLMPMMNFRLANPDHLVDLGAVEELAGISETESEITIGAMTTQRALERSEIITRACPLLAEAVRHVGHQQTRNRGTLGGSLCHLDPGAELPVVAAALEARLFARGPKGERMIPFAEFPAGYLSSALHADEILTRVVFPKLPSRTGTAFIEFNRRPADFAIVSAAACVTLGDDGKIRRCAVALGGSFEAPMRLYRSEQAMIDSRIDENLTELAAREAQSLPCDGDGVYPAEYRRELAGVMAARALGSAFTRARNADHV